MQLANAASTRELARLAVFPLHDAILIPRGHLPLHIFEPRYRQMTADCLADNSPMAIAQPTRDEFSHRDRPPLRPIAGLGRIVVHEALPEGRSLIVLQGIQRVRIATELDSALPYRLVKAVPIEDVPSDPGQVADATRILREMINSLARQVPDGHLLIDACQSVSQPADLADMIGAGLIRETEDRLDFLQQRDVVSRVERAIDAVATLLGGLQSQANQAN
jgi:Lon protease-like protein